MTTLRIVELFPEHLAVNGDMGNVRVLRERLRLAGIDSEHVRHNPGESLPESADLVTIGTGPVSAQRVLEPAISAIAERLREWRDAGVPMLAVTGGMQILGTTLRVPGGDAIAGANVFDMSTDATAPRVVTNCYVVDTDTHGRLVGIENHGASVKLGAAAQPFGARATGRGNGDGRWEGVVQGNAIGTHLQGPVLAMNPVLADHLITVACTRAGLEFTPNDHHAHLDALARECRRILTSSEGIALERVG